MSNLQEITINGTKFEIDMSTARKIDQYRIGDNVKVLRKKDVYSSSQMYNGVITEFANFEELPTIVVAIHRDDYGSTDLDFIYFNEETEDYSLCPALEHENMLDENSVVNTFQRKIDHKKRELEELEAKRDWFIKNFAKYFKEA